MTSKEFFRYLKQLENQIESKSYMAQTYRTLAEGLSSPIYSDMPKKASRELEPMAKALTKALEIEDEIKELKFELASQKAKGMDAISMLEKEYQILLIKRYFEKKSWGQIAASMYFSERWIYKLHGLALKDLDQLFS